MRLSTWTFPRLRKYRFYLPDSGMLAVDTPVWAVADNNRIRYRAAAPYHLQLYYHHFFPRAKNRRMDHNRLDFQCLFPKRSTLSGRDFL